MVLIQCDICKESYFLEDFLFLRCGHGFCNACSVRMRRQRVCPICRHPKDDEAPRPVYINFATEPTVSDALSDETDVEKLISDIKREIQNMKGRRKQTVPKSVKTTKESVEAELRLEQNTALLLSIVEQQIKNPTTLDQRLASRIIQDQATANEALQTEVNRLQKELHATNEKSDKFAGLALNYIQGGGAEIERLNEVVERFRGETKKKDEEILKLRRELEQKGKESRLHKHKLHVLVKAAKQRKGADDEMDGSFQIVNCS